MPCFHPLTRISYPEVINIKTGKCVGRVVPWIDYCDRNNPEVVYQDIPCGKCRACRLQYSKQWADRLLLEGSLHDTMYFFTITYDDLHLPLGGVADPETGEFVGTNPTLSVRDTQLFLKRVRRAFPDDTVRFYLCGEYGSQTFRPHYHAIIFGLHLTDLEPVRDPRTLRPLRSKHGYALLHSPAIDRCWTDDNCVSKGYIVITEASWETCAYTARYVTSKLTGREKHFYDDHGIIPPFATMSRRPGIAHDFYHDGIFDTTSIHIAGRSIKPPRYFESIFERVDPNAYSAYLTDKQERYRH